MIWINRKSQNGDSDREKYIHRKLNNVCLSKGKEPYWNFRTNEHLQNENYEKQF